MNESSNDTPVEELEKVRFDDEKESKFMDYGNIDDGLIQSDNHGTGYPDIPLQQPPSKLLPKSPDLQPLPIGEETVITLRSQVTRRKCISSWYSNGKYVSCSDDTGSDMRDIGLAKLLGRMVSLPSTRQISTGHGQKQDRGLIRYS